MSYAKPEVNILGTAAKLIEATVPKGSTNMEGPPLSGNPAYDLDE